MNILLLQLGSCEMAAKQPAITGGTQLQRGPTGQEDPNYGVHRRLMDED